MVTNHDDLGELRRLLRRITRGMWLRRGPSLGERRLGRRHVGLLAHVGTEGPSTVSELAAALGISLPAASTLTRELEEQGLVERREDPADRRRTVVTLDDQTAKAVREWVGDRYRPLEQALASLTATERKAFLKGLRALGDALMEESTCGPVRSHHCAPHRRGAHRDRPV